MSPRLVIRNRMTPLPMAEDMSSKLHEGLGHVICRKSLNVCWRPGPCLDIPVLPKNPLWQVTDHPVGAGHDPFGVPAYILKGRDVPSSLVRPPGDMRMVQRINGSSIVSRIRKAPGRFPLTHKRGNSRVVGIIFNPQNDVREVCQIPSLQTQRNKFILAQVLYKQLYIYDPISKKEEKQILPQARSCHHHRRPQMSRR